MKFLITGDYHLAEQNRLYDFIKQLDFIEKQSSKEEYDYYINMGDIFENKKPTPLELKIFSNHINTIKAKRKLIVIGNHDELSDTLTNIDWLPSNVEVKKVFELKLEKKIYLAHRTVSEAKTGLDWRLNEISFKELAKQTKADIIILGHIHTPQIVNESNPLVFHPGSIEKNTFGERNDNKYIWDLTITKTKVDLKKIKLNIRPMQYIIYNIDEGTLKVNDKKVNKLNTKNAIVKVDIIGKKEKINKIDYDKLLDKFSDVHKLDFNFIYSDEKVHNKEIDEKITTKSDTELLREYGKEMNIDKKIIKLGGKIINEFK